MWRGGQRKREGGGTGRGGVGFASSARGYHSLEQAESDSVRRRRKDEVRKWPEERPHSRQFSRPFSRVPMSFKRRLPPLRQATNVLRGSAPTSHPLPPARVSSRGLAGQPIARRVESRALYPTPPSAACLSRLFFPFRGRQPMGRRIWLPRRGSPNPPSPKNQQRRRGLASCLGCAAAPFVLLSSARLVPSLRCVDACVFSHRSPGDPTLEPLVSFYVFPTP